MEHQINYIHTVEMTKEEKLKMYMKLTKRELALMLIEANNHVETLRGDDVHWVKPWESIAQNHLESEEFNELMQKYRPDPIKDQAKVIKAFEDMKKFIELQINKSKGILARSWEQK